jgi:hypothetical protein
MFEMMAPLQEQLNQLQRVLSPTSQNNQPTTLEEPTPKPAGSTPTQEEVTQACTEATTDTSFLQHLMEKFPAQAHRLVEIHKDYTSKVQKQPLQPITEDTFFQEDREPTTPQEIQPENDDETKEEVAFEKQAPDFTDTEFTICPTCHLIFHHTDHELLASHTSQCVNPPNANKTFHTKEEAKEAIRQYQLIHQRFISHTCAWHMHYQDTQMSEEESDDNDSTKDDKHNNKKNDSTDEDSESSSSSDDTSESGSSSGSDSSSETDHQETTGTPIPMNTTNVIDIRPTRANRIGYYIPVDRTNRVLYELTPSSTFRHDHIHNQYFEREEV